MKKYIFLFCMCMLAGTALAQSLEVAVKAGEQVSQAGRIATRVAGAEIGGYSEIGRLWAQEYRLNEKFLQDVSFSAAQPLTHVPQVLPTIAKLPKPIQQHTRVATTVKNGGGAAQNTMLPRVMLHYEWNLNWINKQPNKGKDFLAMETDAPQVALAEKLADEKMIFIGEIHGKLAPRRAVADVIEHIHRLRPGRKIVVFAESLYLKPLPNESSRPYTYYRRGEEGVEEPFDIHDASSPNARVMQGDTSFNEMFTKLHENGVEIYPLEDAVVTQVQRAEDRISSVQGLAERNRGFSRVMQSQIERIRQTDPDALFVFFGGMAHVSWNMPLSLPKFFAPEKPVVVEVAEASNPKTFSLLPSVWEPSHPLFTPGTQERLFWWRGEKETARQWGRQTGFDFRLNLP